MILNAYILKIHREISVRVTLSTVEHSKWHGSVLVQLLILLPTVSTNDLLLSCFACRLLSAAALEVDVVADNVADLSLD